MRRLELQGFAAFLPRYFYVPPSHSFWIVNYNYLSTSIFASPPLVFVQIVQPFQNAPPPPFRGVNSTYHISQKNRRECFFQHSKKVVFFVISAQYVSEISVRIFHSFLKSPTQKIYVSPIPPPILSKKSRFLPKISFIILFWIFFTFAFQKPNSLRTLPPPPFASHHNRFQILMYPCVYAELSVGAAIGRPPPNGVCEQDVGAGAQWAPLRRALPFRLHKHIDKLQPYQSCKD